MKKLFTIAVIFILTSIIVGCKSSSILKRRYTKGYYVHHSGKHSEPRTNQKTAAVAPVKAMDAVTVKNTVSQPAASVQKDKTATASVERTERTTQAAVAAQKPAAKQIGTAEKFKLLPTVFSAKKQLKLIETLKSKATADSADDALSLLWIIILILLIIYLLGFAFDGYGLGALIHLLALIILILLILWLLRIL